MTPQPSKFIFLDFLLNVIARGSGAPFAFLANIIIAKALGPKEFGVYMVLLSSAYLVGGIAVFGTDIVMVREIAKGWKNKSNSYLMAVGQWGISRVFIMSLIGGVLLIVWLVIDDSNLGTARLEIFSAVFFLVPASASIIIISSFLIGMDNALATQAINNPIRNGLLIIGLMALFFLKIPNQISHIINIQTITFVVSSMAGWYWIRKKNNGPALLKYFKKNDNKTIVINENIKEWRLSSWHFFIGTAGILVLNKVDIILVSALSEATTAGFYGAAIRVGQIVSTVGYAGLFWLQPKIVNNIHLKQKKTLLLSLKQGCILISSGTLFFCMIVYFSADYIISFIGPDFQVAATPLRWISFGYVIWALCLPLYALLLMSGAEATTAKILWVQVIVNIGLIFILVPVFGVNGASWAWVGGMTSTSLLTIWYGYQQLKRILNG